MVQIFTAFFLTSITGTALALILTLLKPLTRKIFSGTWHYYMWLVILFVMIIPIRLNLPASSVPATPVSKTEAITDNSAKDAESPIIAVTSQQNIQEQNILPEKPSTLQAIKNYLSNKIHIFTIIWLAGALLLFLIKIAAYIIFSIKLQLRSEQISCPQIKAYTNRKVKTRVSDTICSPLMVGIIKPTLLLPKTIMTAEQLHNVLAHEMTHLKRNDILYKWFVSIIKCIHWFNPAIYRISNQINIDCEISCDLSVTSRMNEQQQLEYIDTILSLVTHNKSRVFPLSTGMTGNKNTLKLRFSMIKNKINSSRKVKILSVVLAVMLFIGAVLASGIINGKFNSGVNISVNVMTDKRQGEEFNLLTIGIDNTNRIDTIMVFNFDGNLLTCMNIPRNTNFSSGSFNSADTSAKTLSLLSLKYGDQQIIDSVKETLGIPIHYYAKVKINAVEDIIDYVGGIEFEVPYDMVYDDPAQDLHINLSSGKHLLSGKEVGHLLRFRDRQHSNGEEIRTITWQTVIKEFLHQVVLGNKLRDIAPLYEIASQNIQTNYSPEALINDYIKLKSINRDNIIIESIAGRNTEANGYFVFKIDFSASKSLLNVFNATGEAADLISVISYYNDVMGFKITLPEQWKGKYQVIQFDNQVAFFHNSIFLKYGKSHGCLFKITKISSSEIITEATGDEYLYRGKNFAFVWSGASDIQVEAVEDADLAENFENMLKDLYFIKNSFSLTDEQLLFTPAN